jgi:hypothetical protein
VSSMLGECRGDGGRTDFGGWTNGSGNEVAQAKQTSSEFHEVNFRRNHECNDRAGRVDVEVI